MEQEEAIGAVARVEGLDARLRREQQRRVFRRLALGRVAEVGQQGEVQVLIAVGEEADLEIVDERLMCAAVSMMAGTTTIVRSPAGCRFAGRASAAGAAARAW